MNKTPVWKGLRGTIVPRSCAGIMGIVNLTPDSFYDGGRHNSPEDGLAYARQLLLDGADIVDLGGESSRPILPRKPAGSCPSLTDSRP